MIRAVVFDVGGTLVDETRMLAGWADWLRVPQMEFFAAVGAAIQGGMPHGAVFRMVAPGVDIKAARREREAAGLHFRIGPADLYPDVAACFAGCRSAGLKVGIAGNQPEAAEAQLAACALGADYIAASARWGVEKPDPRFFELVAEASGVPMQEIAYVGDRVDNDVVPARAAGMVPVLLARGPWGVVHSEWEGAADAALTVRTLDGLAERLAALPT